MFKIGFQNCNTISVKKLNILQRHLSDFDVIFLSEINKKNFSFANSDIFQHHHDPEVPRIGLIAVQTVKIKPLGIGVKIEQVRVQTDKTAAQSFVFEVKNEEKTLIVENFYVVPDAKIEVVNSIISHIHNQATKYTNYCCGGDMNMNWTDKKTRDLFSKFSTYTQHVNKPTRCRKYFKDGEPRTSNTTIDLFFSNSSLKPWINSVTPMQISDAFDHKIVAVTIRQKTSLFYRKIKKPTNHLIRPTPNAGTIAAINSEIVKIDPAKSKNYDSYFGEVRQILDNHLPFNKPGTTEFIIYRVPFPPELVKEIRLKHKLEKLALKTIANKQAYSRQRNKVSNLCKKAKKKFFDDLINRSKPEGIQEKIKFMQLGLSSNLKSDRGRIELEGYTGQALADEMSSFYRKRACDLVTDEEMLAAGPQGPVLRENESLPEQLKIEFPVFDDLFEHLPRNKLSNSCGLSGISAKVLEFIWPSVKETFNSIVHSPSFSFPEIDMGYLQRTIPKIALISILKHLRPLGVLDPIVKYLINKPVFSQLRKHIEPILKKRNNYSYRGTHLCIIKTFDAIIGDISDGKSTMLVKYDFSNAFGTLSHDSVMQALSQLNIDDFCIKFLNGYLTHQRQAKTIVSDDFGIYVSDITTMDRGCAQGQIGADVLFIIQQLVLHELDGVLRCPYVDDLNDEIATGTSKKTLQLARENQRHLVQQSASIGFAINDDKTTNILFNITDKEVKNFDEKMKFVRSSFILGVDFKATPKGPDLTPAADAIIKRLNMNAPTIHASREYNSFDVRVKIARQKIYESIGDLHLVVGFDPSKIGRHARSASALFDRVRVKVNELIRATGLRRTTPCEVLDQVLGTNLHDFVIQGIIMNGLKSLDHTITDEGIVFHGVNLNDDEDEGYFDRTDQIRARYAPGTYMGTFVQVWNDLDKKVRRDLLMKKNFEQIKNYLKNRRKIKDIKLDVILSKYYWIDYKNQN